MSHVESHLPSVDGFVWVGMELGQDVQTRVLSV